MDGKGTDRPARRVALAAVVAALALLVTSGSSAATDSSSAGSSVNVVMRGVDNQVVATVNLTQINATSVLVAVAARGLTPGFHGFHVHAVGICDPNAKDATGAVVPFASAGGHFNPAGTTHGAHAGDLPVLLVQQSGVAVGTVVTDRFRVADLQDADGSAIIIHVGADNLANIPARYVQAATGTPGPDATTLATGDAGGRFACGVVH
jgi:superoxide dismutase, Cu-Zn family